MNCPTCGAVNDADARFCAECGAPLEYEVVEAVKAGPASIEDDEDRTILSTPGEIASEAKTITVDQVDVSPGPADIEPVIPPEPEPLPPSSDVVPPVTESTGGGDSGDGETGGTSGGGSGGFGSPVLITIVVLAIVFLCCCCCSVGLGVNFAEDINFLLYDISDALGF